MSIESSLERTASITNSIVFGKSVAILCIFTMSFQLFGLQCAQIFMAILWAQHLFLIADNLTDIFLIYRIPLLIRYIYRTPHSLFIDIFCFCYSIFCQFPFLFRSGVEKNPICGIFSIVFVLQINRRKK